MNTTIHHFFEIRPSYSSSDVLHFHMNTIIHQFFEIRPSYRSCDVLHFHMNATIHHFLEVRPSYSSCNVLSILAQWQGKQSSDACWQSVPWCCWDRDSKCAKLKDLDDRIPVIDDIKQAVTSQVDSWWAPNWLARKLHTGHEVAILGKHLKYTHVGSLRKVTKINSILYIRNAIAHSALSIIITSSLGNFFLFFIDESHRQYKFIYFSVYL